jgi:hypothetical protein
MARLAQLLLVIGAIFCVVGFLVIAAQKLSFLSWVGRLPGDIRIEGRNTSFYFPITTYIIFSALLSLLFALVRSLGGR